MNFGASHQQRGLALITAVLVVAIVATTAATLALGEQVWFRQSQNMADRAQAESLRQGALNYATILLARDLKLNSNGMDHLGEPWAQPLPPFPVENGLIVFGASDAQGLFNLNNLVKNGVPSPDDNDMFVLLLTALGLNPELRFALIDWIDADPNVTPGGGAEDTEYLSLPRPYRTANRLLESVDELRLVRGFDAKTVEKLRPFVTALPRPTTINVNTAPEQVLAALFRSPPGATLKPLLTNRVNQPFPDVTTFASQFPPGNQPLPVTGVTTNYFLVNIDVRYGRLQRRTLALVHRPQGAPTTVLWHQLPPIQFETEPDEKT